MAVDFTTNPDYNTRITPADPATYPWGSAKNETAPAANDGTPYLKSRADDVIGLQQAILLRAGLTPSGNSDTALNSQYLEGLTNLFGETKQNYIVNGPLYHHGWQNGTDVTIPTANSISSAKYGPDQYVFYHTSGGGTSINVVRTNGVFADGADRNRLTACSIRSDNSTATTISIGNIMRWRGEKGTFTFSAYMNHGTNASDYPALLSVYEIDPSSRNILTTYVHNVDIGTIISSSSNRLSHTFDISTLSANNDAQFLYVEIKIPGQNFSASNWPFNFAGWMLQKSPTMLGYFSEDESLSFKKVNSFFETSYNDGVAPLSIDTNSALYIESTSPSTVERALTVPYTSPKVQAATINIYTPMLHDGLILDGFTQEIYGVGAVSIANVINSSSLQRFTMKHTPVFSNTLWFFHYVADARV